MMQTTHHDVSPCVHMMNANNTVSLTSLFSFRFHWFSETSCGTSLIGCLVFSSSLTDFKISFKPQFVLEIRSCFSEKEEAGVERPFSKQDSVRDLV